MLFNIFFLSFSYYLCLKCYNQLNTSIFTGVNKNFTRVKKYVERDIDVENVMFKSSREYFFTLDKEVGNVVPIGTLNETTCLSMSFLPQGQDSGPERGNLGTETVFLYSPIGRSSILQYTSSKLSRVGFDKVWSVGVG